MAHYAIEPKMLSQMKAAQCRFCQMLPIGMHSAHGGYEHLAARTTQTIRRRTGRRWQLWYRSEYVRMLICRDQDRAALPEKLLEGAHEAKATSDRQTVILRRATEHDVDAAIDHHRTQASIDVTFDFVAELDETYDRIAQRSLVGSSRYAHDLEIEGLRLVGSSDSLA